MRRRRGQFAVGLLGSAAGASGEARRDRMGEPQPVREGDRIQERFMVEKKLGEGGFGAVFRIREMATGRALAMKVEGSAEQIQVLKMEVVVLRELAKRGASRHVCRIETQGRTRDFNYVIMTLVGTSLQDLRRQCNRSFTPATALRVGIQCLEALEDLHSIGYLHRDVKPGNFAIGKEETGETGQLFILDFGMARQFRKATGELRTPRAAAGFRGTVRYASLGCHNSKEQCRKDDLEAWFYQQEGGVFEVEITAGVLPWSAIEDMKAVGAAKVETRRNGTLLAGLPPDYGALLAYIDGLTYTDDPNYRRIYALLSELHRQTGKRMTDPLDWERGGCHYRPPQPAPGAGGPLLQPPRPHSPFPFQPQPHHPPPHFNRW